MNPKKGDIFLNSKTNTMWIYLDKWTDTGKSYYDFYEKKRKKKVIENS